LVKHFFLISIILLIWFNSLIPQFIKKPIIKWFHFYYFSEDFFLSSQNFLFFFLKNTQAHVLYHFILLLSILNSFFKEFSHFNKFNFQSHLPEYSIKDLDLNYSTCLSKSSQAIPFYIFKILIDNYFDWIHHHWLHLLNLNHNYSKN